MKKMLITAVPLILSAAVLMAFDRPVPDAKLTQVFGTNSDGTPALGESFQAAGTVFAVNPGEVIFSMEDGDERTGFVNPLGAWVAVDHGDGLIGIYARAAGDNAREQRHVGRDTALTAAGVSGWSDDTGFYFTFYDRKERRWVNPMMICGPVEDTIAPVIEHVGLQGADGVITNLSQTRSIRQGRYGIVVGASDRAESGAGAIAPYRITCSLNGVDAGLLALEIFAAPNGRLMLYGNDLVPAARNYANPPRFEAAAGVFFARGEAAVVISVQDFSKNTKIARYYLKVE